MQKIDTFQSLQTAQEAPDDPLALFKAWLEEAEKSEPSDPNAMCLATTDAEGKPTARIMLLKAVDENGFVFYTNKESRKGNTLAANPYAALSFYWKTTGKQVRVEGTVSSVSDEEADAYYATRGRGSRIGAWASQQSRPLKDSTTLHERITEYEGQYAGQDHIPRPPHWSGYCVKPEHIEFWVQGEHRIHRRVLYTRTENVWHKMMLYP